MKNEIRKRKKNLPRAQETSSTSLGPFFVRFTSSPSSPCPFVVSPSCCRSIVVPCCRSLAVLWFCPFPPREQVLAAVVLGAGVVPLPLAFVPPSRHALVLSPRLFPFPQVLVLVLVLVPFVPSSSSYSSGWSSSTHDHPASRGSQRCVAGGGSVSSSCQSNQKNLF
jgi:hypothetical protein